VEASALQAPAVGIARISLAPRLLRLRSDEQLVALFRAGNDDAFRVIHDRYRQRLFAYSRQMLTSRQDAEDALQDVFIRAYSALRASNRPIALRAWLYRVAHNRCVDELRRPLPPPAELMDVSRGPMPDPLAEAERRDDLKRLVADMRRLPAQQRSVLLMRELEGLSYADLADTLDVTVPAVKSLLVRARMGLVEAAEARDTACADIRHDLALAHGRGVRANARARRHLRDCDACRVYRHDMRRVQRSLASLVPVAGGPLALLAKLTGLGGSGGGAAGGGGAAAAGTGVAGGGVAAGTGVAGSGAAAGTGLAGGGVAAGTSLAGAAGTGIAGSGMAAGTGVAATGVAATSGVAAGGGIAGGGLATASGLATGGGIAAGGGMAAGGGLAAGGAAALTAGKVAAVVSAVVVAGSGAAAVEQQLVDNAKPTTVTPAAQVQPAPERIAPAAPILKPKADVPAAPTDAATAPAKDPTHSVAPASGSSDTGPASSDSTGSGGLAAPADTAADASPPASSGTGSGTKGIAAPSGTGTSLAQPRTDGTSSPSNSTSSPGAGAGGKPS
jgi:RNA polymerase sigma factor (sigma-70 family)